MIQRRAQSDPFLLMLFSLVLLAVGAVLLSIASGVDPAALEAAAGQTETGQTGTPLVSISVGAVLAVAVGWVVSRFKSTEETENDTRRKQP